MAACPCCMGTADSRAETRVRARLGVGWSKLRRVGQLSASFCFDRPQERKAVLSHVVLPCTAMASFAEAPSGDKAKGEKIFKTKCAQCHVPEKGGGHKQVRFVLAQQG